MAILATLPLFADATLKAYWKLDGNSNDAKGSNNGTDTNVSYVSGKYNQAASVSGSGYIEAVDSADLDPTSALSIGGWINPTENNASYYSVMIKPFVGAAGGNEQYFIQRDGGGSNVLGGIKAGGSMANVTSTTSWASLLNSWNLVIVTYDGSNLKIYINGVLEGTTVKSGSLNTDTYAMGLGGTSNVNYTKFKGSLDEMFLFSKALSVDEITTIYRESSGYYGRTWG